MEKAIKMAMVIRNWVFKNFSSIITVLTVVLSYVFILRDDHMDLQDQKTISVNYSNRIYQLEMDKVETKNQMTNANKRLETIEQNQNKLQICMEERQKEQAVISSKLDTLREKVDGMKDKMDFVIKLLYGNKQLTLLSTNQNQTF